MMYNIVEEFTSQDGYIIDCYYFLEALYDYIDEHQLNDHFEVLLEQWCNANLSGLVEFQVIHQRDGNLEFRSLRIVDDVDAMAFILRWM